MGVNERFGWIMACHPVDHVSPGLRKEVIKALHLIGGWTLMAHSETDLTKWCFINQLSLSPWRYRYRRLKLKSAERWNVVTLWHWRLSQSARRSIRQIFTYQDDRLGFELWCRSVIGFWLLRLVGYWKPVRDLLDWSNLVYVQSPISCSWVGMK